VEVVSEDDDSDNGNAGGAPQGSQSSIDLNALSEVSAAPRAVCVCVCMFGCACLCFLAHTRARVSACVYVCAGVFLRMCMCVDQA